MTSDELLFAENLKKLEPILQILISLTNAGHISMANQRFRMESNQQTINLQEKTITENKALIEDAKEQATSIINMAKEKAQEIEIGIKKRMAEVNHRERESISKLEEFEKILWESQDKKKVKING